MKKVFIGFVAASLLLSFSSCKKSFDCICEDSAGDTLYEGVVSASSQSKAEDEVKNKGVCAGAVQVECSAE